MPKLPPKVLEKALKLKALMERGVPGERDNAKVKYEQYLEKHGIDPSEFIEKKAEPVKTKKYAPEQSESLLDLFNKAYHHAREIGGNSDEVSVYHFLDGELIASEKMPYYDFHRYMQLYGFQSRLFQGRAHIYSTPDELVVSLFQYDYTVKKDLTDEQANGKVINSRGARGKKEWMDLTADGIKKFMQK